MDSCLLFRISSFLLNTVLLKVCTLSVESFCSGKNCLKKKVSFYEISPKVTKNSYFRIYYHILFDSDFKQNHCVHKKVIRSKHFYSNYVLTDRARRAL